MDSFVRSATLLTLSLLCIITSNAAHNDSAVKAREFDYFALALEWPPTICRSNRHCCPSNACCHGVLDSPHFTIHGLWPDYNDGTWPQCCSGPRYDERKLVSLMDKINKYWPSMSCNHPSDCHGKRGTFWEHEWEKHGTCSFPVIKDEYSYFSTALELGSKYNILDILKDAGLTPNNHISYHTDQIISATRKVIGATPLLVCKQGAIEEIRICLDKTFKPHDCGIDHRDSCHGHVLIPLYQTSGTEKLESPKLLSPLQKIYKSLFESTLGGLLQLQRIWRITIPA